MASRVLSIQSHVSFGYVGGKAAVFPLQCLGFDVDVVNTVNFSNHSGYGRFGGSKATTTDLTTVFETMDANGLLSQERILTGYIPGAEALSVIAKLARRLKTKNQNIIYLLDPVLGDSGKLYVAADVIPIYRELLPYATIITPNWFEVETLTRVPLNDVPSLHRALRVLHEEFRVPNVVISSIPLFDFLRKSLPARLVPTSVRSIDGAAYLLCISSSRNLSASRFATQESSNGNTELSTVHVHVLPCIPGYFSGVGDLFSALVLAHYHPARELDPSDAASSATKLDTRLVPQSLAKDASHTPLSIATSLALSKTFAILKLTDELVSATSPISDDATDEERDRNEPERRVRRMRTRELRLIQGQDLLRGVPTNDGVAMQLREMRPWSGFWSQVRASHYQNAEI